MADHPFHTYQAFFYFKEVPYYSDPLEPEESVRSDPPCPSPGLLLSELYEDGPHIRFWAEPTPEWEEEDFNEEAEERREAFYLYGQVTEILGVANRVMDLPYLDEEKEN